MSERPACSASLDKWEFSHDDERLGWVTAWEFRESECWIEASRPYGAAMLWGTFKAAEEIRNRIGRQPQFGVVDGRASHPDVERALNGLRRMRAIDYLRRVGVLPPRSASKGGPLNKLKGHALWEPLASLDEPRQTQDGEARPLGVEIADLFADDPEDRAIEAWIPPGLRSALESLTPRERQVIELRILEPAALPYGEVAKRLGITPGYARRVYSQAIGRLRRAIEAEPGQFTGPGSRPPGNARSPGAG